MAQHIKPMNKIIQRSVGFNLRQILFFAENPDFKPDMFCRKAIDEQISLIDPKYLDENTKTLKEVEEDEAKTY